MLSELKTIIKEESATTQMPDGEHVRTLTTSQIERLSLQFGTDGKTIEITGVGQAFSGAYYVVSVKHTIGPTGYRTRFEVTRNSV